MTTIIAEITDPLDVAAINAELSGLDLVKNNVMQMAGFLNVPDYVSVEVSFNVESEADTFWTWIQTHGNAGGGWAHKHDCTDVGPCILNAEKDF